MAPQPPPRRPRCTMRKMTGHELPTFETFAASAPSHVALTSSAYSPIAPPGYIGVCGAGAVEGATF
ncbi:hypothetical protein FB451DRAFT_1567128 [Mycena latifolia]|nr:hypothetical protein FB451DRAFT_1567128 [Mycena latifolia]